MTHIGNEKNTGCLNTSHLVMSIISSKNVSFETEKENKKTSENLFSNFILTIGCIKIYLTFSKYSISNIKKRYSIGF